VALDRLTLTTERAPVPPGPVEAAGTERNEADEDFVSSLRSGQPDAEVPRAAAAGAA
jgi:hypothetical protein